MKNPLLSNKYVFELEKRIEGELTAELMYRQLSASMQQLGYFGAAKFFLNEANAEVEHYQKIIDFCNDLGVLPNYNGATRVMNDINTFEDAFKVAYDAELNLLNEYKNLSNMSCNDEYAMFYFSQEFVKEQVKSVGEYGDLLATINLTKDNAAGLLQIDHELGENE
jgi:ferritin